MLAPAAITLRRPSGEVDLILHKKDFVVCKRYEPRSRSPPFRVCHSANTSPASSNLPSPDESGSVTSLQSTASSPNANRRSWFSKMVQLKEDADKINKRMKSKRGLRGSVECLKTKLSSKKEQTPSKRTLRVEKISSARKSKRGSKDDTCFVSYDQADHNLTTSLLMTNLEEGYFSAELSLLHLPSGNLTARIRDYKLEIISEQDRLFEHSGKPRKTLHYCGSLAIPIFVVPQTLELWLNEERNVIEMRGMTKGYQYQRMSSSATELRSKAERPKSNKLTAGLMRLFSNAKESDADHKDSNCLEVEDDGMRERAYTR
jgi:hypothetical protein